MVAQYQKKFGFTAILISHDIPDVFFISNRILALYDKRIVFEGSAEEFEILEHPFMDELVGSLEGLQQELTGLYSRRHFKVRYQTDLAKNNPNDTYVAALFKLENMAEMCDQIGHAAAQQVMRALGAFIYKHFGAVGAFSSRQTFDEFGTVLPFSDMEEAERILADFAKDFQKNGIKELKDAIQSKMAGNPYPRFTVSAGLAQGKPQVEIESVMEFARYRQKPIASFETDIEGATK